MGRFRRSWLAVPLSVALLLGVVPAATFAADSDLLAQASSADIEQPAAVPVEPVKFGGAKLKDDAKSHPWRSPQVTWPVAASTEVELDGSTALLKAAAYCRSVSRRRSGNGPDRQPRVMLGPLRRGCPSSTGKLLTRPASTACCWPSNGRMERSTTAPCGWRWTTPRSAARTAVTGRRGSAWSRCLPAR